MYAELVCRSNYSFLQGASHPEELVRRAAELGLSALAITDDDGFTTLHQVADALVALLPCPTHGRLHLGPHQLVVTWSPHQLDAVARLWERLYTMRLSS